MLGWIIVMVALGLVACAGAPQSAPTGGPAVWQNADGEAATLSDLRSVAFKCPNQIAAPIDSPQQLGFPSAGALAQFHQHIMDSPGYGALSAAEFHTCMQAAGYTLVPLRPAGQGSSTPAQH